jgi:hypothetical protein
MRNSTKYSLTLADNSKVAYFDHEAIVCGDYCDAGSVGASNVKYIEDNFAEHIHWGLLHGDHLELETHPNWLGVYAIPEGQVTGEWTKRYPETAPAIIRIFAGFGTTLFLFRSDLATLGDEFSILADQIDMLDDYPCFDDEIVSEIESEWETEAWENWLRSDLTRSLPDDLDDDEFDWTEDELRDAYRTAMDETNTYPTPECSSVYVDVDRIKDSFADALRSMRK